MLIFVSNKCSAHESLAGSGVSQQNIILKGGFTDNLLGLPVELKTMILEKINSDWRTMNFQVLIDDIASNFENLQRLDVDIQWKTDMIRGRNLEGMRILTEIQDDKIKHVTLFNHIIRDIQDFTYVKHSIDLLDGKDTSDIDQYKIRDRLTFFVHRDRVEDSILVFEKVKQLSSDCDFNGYGKFTSIKDMVRNLDSYKTWYE